MSDASAPASPFGNVSPFRDTHRSRRRAPRTDVVTFEVRVTLADTMPPVSRTLAVASDLYLDELHDIIQTAFGWNDSHLHGFSSDPHYYGTDFEQYLCPQQVDLGDAPGIPEEQVRLDELLRKPTDTLTYCYDFGDNWLHTITLNQITDRTPHDHRAVCLAGGRPAPAEDSGGPHGFEMLAAANNPEHPAHTAARNHIAELYGPETNPADWAPTPLDIDAVNHNLTTFGTGPTTRTGEANTPIPTPLLPLMAAVPHPLRRSLQRMINAANLTDPITPDLADATEFAKPYVRLLNRIGNGVKLTAAGYLPPAVVHDIFTDFGFDKSWIGKGNREDLTPQVADLRQSLTRLGLLRKHTGKLLPTKLATTTHHNPILLWHHISQRFPAVIGPSPRKDRSFEHEALALLMLAIATGADHPVDTIAPTLTTAGWRIHGELVTPGTVYGLIHENIDLLIHSGHLITHRRYDPSPTVSGPPARDFARAVLASTL
ncbi:plasmid pRiA4b ORF-3 family protein [Nocardia sp. NPDC058640]|uniref:plasmid pRiA4b ORF-3 family protein n=1 Tax=Nocardia sp. NPDC058640 TaxID=3346571 RepID=UPI0036606F3B